jgi:hypothetical protein
MNDTICFTNSSNTNLDRGDMCIEMGTLLDELRTDALQSAGLYDEYIRLCERALRQAGTLDTYDRLIVRYELLARQKLVFDRVLGIHYAPALERLRTEIEAQASADYESRFGVAPHSVKAVNVRSEGESYWQAVRITKADGASAWYYVDMADDDDFICEFLDDFDLECYSPSSSVIGSISDVFEDQLGW